MPRPTLPPLPAVRAFEAAARHGSFTAAGNELNLTQAAVSYQIKVLEERVGQPLFHRRARGVELTKVGRALAREFTLALDQIADSFAHARGIADGTLAISVIPTMATNFLAERMGRFQIAHPTIAVRMEVSETVVDFRADGFDLSIRSGKGEWPGLVSHKLFDIEFTPLLSPNLAQSVGGINEPGDLFKVQMLAGFDPWWERWCETAGLDSTKLPDTPKQAFGSQVVEATAAKAGQGVAMLTPAFFRNEILSGQLIQPFDLTCRDGSAYWLTYPHDYRNAPRIKTFKKWLDAELDDFRAG